MKKCTWTEKTQIHSNTGKDVQYHSEWQKPKCNLQKALHRCPGVGRVCLIPCWGRNKGDDSLSLANETRQRHSQTRWGKTHLWSKLLRRLRQENRLSPGVQDELERHSEKPYTHQRQHTPSHIRGQFRQICTSSKHTLIKINLNKTNQALKPYKDRSSSLGVACRDTLSALTQAAVVAPSSRKWETAYRWLFLGGCS